MNLKKKKPKKGACLLLHYHLLLLQCHFSSNRVLKNKKQKYNTETKAWQLKRLLDSLFYSYFQISLQNAQGHVQTKVEYSIKSNSWILIFISEIGSYHLDLQGFVVHPDGEIGVCYHMSYLKLMLLTEIPRTYNEGHPKTMLTMWVMGRWFLNRRHISL